MFSITAMLSYRLLDYTEGPGHQCRAEKPTCLAVQWIQIFFSLFASTGGWSALCEEPWQYPPPTKLKKILLALPQPGGVWLGGMSACISLQSLCHRGKSILNKPSESFLCYTFHFPSSKLQGKLACQEDDREQAAEESNREGDEKNDPTPTIKLTNHCS